METSKVISKSKNISQLLDTAFQKDLEGICETITKNFDITQHGSNVTSEYLLRYLRMKFGEHNLHCCAITNSGMRCSRRCIEGNKYCKTHFSKIVSFPNLKSANGTLSDSVYFVKKDSPEIVSKELEKVFIEDSFYFVDSNFIYDIDTNEKVGYVDNLEYVLTSDPFVLNVRDT